MPVYLTSYLNPKTPASTLGGTDYIPYFLIEDVFIKGGFQIKATYKDRDAINTFTRKAGMLVVTQNDNKIWQLASDKITWNEFKPGADKVLIGQAPIIIDPIDGSISVDKKYIIPQTGNDGDYLVRDVTGAPTWKALNLNNAIGSRVTDQYNVPGTILAGASFDFDLTMSQTIMLLQLAVDQPWQKIQAFSTPERNEPNPYTFKSNLTILQDDGTTELSDGTKFYGRRYSILANLQIPALNKIYWRITNQAATPVQPKIKYTYIVTQ